MSVNMRIYLPATVQLRDVADVIGIVSGLTPKKELFTPMSRGWAARVDGIEFRDYPGTPEMVEIIVAKPHRALPLVDGEHVHSITYHFEAVDPNGRACRYLAPKSTAFWIAVGNRLLEFFGGVVDYNDSDLIEIDKSERAKPYNSHEDDRAFGTVQRKKMDLKPITCDEIMRYVKVSGYSK
jgi:hypothetical protein